MTTEITEHVLTCDNMTTHPTCEGVVAMIDNKGFIYCQSCGERRQRSHSCRRLRPWELAKLKRGEALARY